MPRSRAALAALALAVACGDGGKPPARTPTPLDRSTTGSISGQVFVDGPAPAMGTVNFGSFGECASQHDGAVPTGDLLVSDGKAQNAFVYIQEGLGNRVFAVPETPVEIDQKGCLYVPRIAGAQVDQTIRYVNSDALLHNVHGTPKDSSAWNVSLPRQGAAREIRVDHPEVMVSVRCDLHPWMQGWLGVVDHPYFAVTDAEGRFALRDVPPGDYTLAVWHERLGSKTTRVTVAPNGAAETRFTYTAAR